MKVTTLAAAVVIAGSFPASAEQLMMVEEKLEECFDVFVRAKNGNGAAIIREEAVGAANSTYRYNMIADRRYYYFEFSTRTAIGWCWVNMSGE